MTLQDFCARTGRTLEAVPPMAVAGAPLTWHIESPWQRLQTEDPSAVIYYAPEQQRTGFSPNVLGTVAKISPAMPAVEAMSAISDTAQDLADWTLDADLYGEGDVDAGGSPSEYRFIRGYYTAEPGRLLTSSLLAGWRTDEAAFVFQVVVTTFDDAPDAHRTAFEGIDIGEHSVAAYIDAMKDD